MTNAVARTMAVNTSGATIFSGVIGGGVALTSLITDAGGTTSALSVTTSGVQTYNDPVTLNGTYTTTNSVFTAANTATLAGATLVTTGNGAITFTGAVDGANTLTANTTGNTTFSAAVGGITPLTSLTTNAGGATLINGGAISTSGAQTYNDNVTLGAPTLLTTTNSDITATGAVNASGNTLTLAAGGGNVSWPMPATTSAQLLSRRPTTSRCGTLTRSI